MAERLGNPIGFMMAHASKSETIRLSRIAIVTGFSSTTAVALPSSRSIHESVGTRSCDRMIIIGHEFQYAGRDDVAFPDPGG